MNAINLEGGIVKSPGNIFFVFCPDFNPGMVKMGSVGLKLIFWGYERLIR